MRSAKEIFEGAGVIWQHKAEFVAFLEWLQQEQVTSILEIGTGLGGSAYCFSEALPGVRIVSVDTAQRHNRPIPNFSQVIGDSRTDSTELVVAGHAPFDLVYFDTEHPYADARDNYERYGKMALRYITQHDINMDEEHWTDAGIPRCYREQAESRGRVIEFVAPAPDPRFPRWGGLGVLRAR